MSIAIEAAELMEVFQWQTTDTAWKVKDSESIAAVQDELADVMIYCLALANQLDIDITEVIGEKMERNQRRFPPTTKLRSEL
ncbi:MAG: nucleotide pyrophosphohydrolase [Firmicutes bacterium]|nr:nucleotide pyrophosphohydrolase [Bacillota bacterium]